THDQRRQLRRLLWSDGKPIRRPESAPRLHPSPREVFCLASGRFAVHVVVGAVVTERTGGALTGHLVLSRRRGRKADEVVNIEQIIRSVSKLRQTIVDLVRQTQKPSVPKGTGLL